jgi:hypothetical protein
MVGRSGEEGDAEARPHLSMRERFTIARERAMDVALGKEDSTTIRLS